MVRIQTLPGVENERDRVHVRIHDTKPLLACICGYGRGVESLFCRCALIPRHLFSSTSNCNGDRSFGD